MLSNSCHMLSNDWHMSFKDHNTIICCVRNLICCVKLDNICIAMYFSDDIRFRVFYLYKFYIDLKKPGDLLPFFLSLSGGVLLFGMFRFERSLRETPLLSSVFPTRESSSSCLYKQNLPTRRPPHGGGILRLICQASRAATVTSDTVASLEIETSKQKLQTGIWMYA